MRLVDVASGRDNNFNLIRMVAAWAVLLSHSFVLATGSDAAEPLRDSLGKTWSAMAVDVFFITSGFLVTASLHARGSALEFVWARILRIYPGLLVMVALVVLGLGLYFTSLPTGQFLASNETRTFVLKNATLIGGVAFTLPGVFDALPYPRAINGSLWTMPTEIRMYAVLLGLWVVLAVLGRRRRAAFSVALVVLALGGLSVHFWTHYQTQTTSSFYRWFYMFFTGAAYFALRARIVLTDRLFWPALAAIVLSALHREVFFAVYSLLLPYVLFWLAYRPGGALRSYNRLGDYSYGVYIYAFPVQQTTVALFPGISALELLMAGTLATLLLASLSWYLIEARALRSKGNAVRVTRRMLGRGRAMRASLP